LSTSSTDPPDDGRLEVGRVARPHGLRGEVVVELWSNRPERMVEGSRLHAGGRELVIARCRPTAPSGGWPRWLVAVAGVETRDGAEGLRGVVLRADPIDDPDALWIHELIGSDVVDPAGRAVGTVAAVEANPASDLLVLEDGRLIPLTFVREERDSAARSDRRRLVVDGPAGLVDE
jgi:16S rRNA processing protein RimM